MAGMVKARGIGLAALEQASASLDGYNKLPREERSALKDALQPGTELLSFQRKTIKFDRRKKERDEE